MKTKIKRCNYCKIYTLKDYCPKCGRPTSTISPPHFSPEDKYGKYRREFKKMEAEKNG
ncbi:MAG: RNA-protein complex protein Nop10 [Thermoplasmata archaeon]